MQNLLHRYRLTLSLFILGLILSGLTAFPLLIELRWLCDALGVPASPPPGGLHHWLATVRNGVEATYAAYPWMGYGTDWLAFGHLVIAMFFIGPWREPVRNDWVLWVGLVACALVIPLAFIAGAVRGIPWGWRIVDCSFGVFGAAPLLYCRHLARRMG